MSTLRVAALKETAENERRVALDPAAVERLARSASRPRRVGRGRGGLVPDEDYRRPAPGWSTGARRWPTPTWWSSVGRPGRRRAGQAAHGQALPGLLAPLTNPDLVRQLADRRVTAISLDGLPRTLSRAQAMDALSSQANVAGYRAVLVAAEHYGRFFPMLMTAAGTSKPATVLVLGAGVAGLQAIGTARRLGAVVTGYDVRPASRDEVNRSAPGSSS